VNSLARFYASGNMYTNRVHALFKSGWKKFLSFFFPFVLPSSLSSFSLLPLVLSFFTSREQFHTKTNQLICISCMHFDLWSFYFNQVYVERIFQVSYLRFLHNLLTLTFNCFRHKSILAKLIRKPGITFREFH